MKKFLSLAGALAALAISGNAMALNTNTVRAIQVDGLNASLGVVNFVALGAAGGFCDYLMDWGSPFNPNDVSLCVIHEARTAFAPSCIVNENVDIISTVVDAGTCIGFNLKGEPAPARLILGESYAGLAGIAVVGTGALPTAYPVRML
jgi:hypothetical protein